MPRSRSLPGFRSLLLLVLAICVALVTGRTAEAAGLLVPRDGSPPIRVKSHRVTAVVDDGLARTTVRQTFVNPHGRALEAVYTFPVPEGAALVGLAMETGGQRLDGFLAERRMARKSYDSLVRRRIDPALVEQIGRSTFRLSVFPVLPDQPTVVEVTWIAPCPVSQGQVRYVYPLADGGEATRTEEDLTFTLTLRSSATIESATSASDGMAVYLRSANEVVASVERTGARLDRDLVVAARVKASEPSIAVRTFRGAKGDPFFAVVVTPPEVDEDKVLPRDVTLALDVSGSMQGPKFDQARASALWLVGNLRPKDRVNVLTFSNEVRSFAERPVDATPENVGKIREFLAATEAAGGTALGDAIRVANSAPAEAGRVAMAVVLTDGLPTVGEEVPARIVEFAAAGATRGLRTYTFGVGADVNAALLDGVARAGRGASEVFRPQGEIESRLRAFLTRTASPVLSDLRLLIDGRAAEDVLPRPLPDLYLGEQAVLTGRAPLTGVHDVVAQATFDGKPITLTAKADFGTPSSDGSAAGAPVVRDIYARQKLEFLAAAHRLRLGLADDAYFAALDRGAYSTADELVQAMLDLSLETGVQCPYTSFLALLPEDRARLDPRDLAAIDQAVERASAKRREIAGLPPLRRDAPPTAKPARPNAPGEAVRDESPPPTPEETKPLEESERVIEDPVLKDAKISDHNESGDDWETEESLGDPRFNSDSPFEGPGNGRTIGIGGGAGGSFGGRRGGHRNLRAGGAGKMTQTAVDVADDWLKTHQNPDGGWGDGGVSEPGATGLALLCFLGAGETHQSGNYKESVKEGLKYLRNIQDSEGCVGRRDAPRWMFGHLTATLALTEAYGMTQSVIFKDSAQRAVNFVHQCQNPYLAWGFGVRDGTNDTMVTAWAVTCLRSATLAGLEVDKSAFDGARTWLDSMTDPDTGAVGANARGVVPDAATAAKVPFPTATAAALDAAAVWARIQRIAALERGPFASADDPFIEKTGARLRACLPTVGAEDPQAWFFGSLAAFQLGGETWKAWSEALERASVGTRITTEGAPERGSWDPVGVWAKEGGRVYVTAMQTLCNEVYYRYGRTLAGR